MELLQDPLNLKAVVTTTVTMHLSTAFCILPQTYEFVRGHARRAVVETTCFVSRSPSVSAGRDCLSVLNPQQRQTSFDGGARRRPT